MRRWWWWERGVRVTRSGDHLVMWSTDYWGRPARVAVLPDTPPDGQDPRELIEGTAMSVLRKADLPNPAVLPGVTLVDPAFSTKYPTLWAHMTQTTWAEGETREPSSLLIFFEGGMLKGMLRDKNAGLCLWCAGNGLTSLFQGLETLLVTPGVDWKVDRAAGTNQKATRVKRA